MKGSGLGLLIAKDYVEMHGGTIEVHSVLGEGSSFVVNLPTNLVQDAVPQEESFSSRNTKVQGNKVNAVGSASTIRSASFALHAP